MPAKMAAFALYDWSVNSGIVTRGTPAWAASMYEFSPAWEIKALTLWSSKLFSVSTWGAQVTKRGNPYHRLVW